MLGPHLNLMNHEFGINGTNRVVVHCAHARYFIIRVDIEGCKPVSFAMEHDLLVILFKPAEADRFSEHRTRKEG